VRSSAAPSIVLPFLGFRVREWNRNDGFICLPSIERGISRFSGLSEGDDIQQNNERSQTPDREIQANEKNAL
jgi:hypothetical protein